jgi:predicted nucleic acid-binding protein
VKIFLDANVLFAASNPVSPTARLIHLLVNRAKAVTCDYAREEARRNVELKWPKRASDFAALMSTIEIVSTQLFPLPINLSPKDAPILCSAIRAGCSHLVTGDKRDFGHLYGQTVQGVIIISLLNLAEILTDTSPQ